MQFILECVVTLPLKKLAACECRGCTSEGLNAESSISKRKVHRAIVEFIPVAWNLKYILQECVQLKRL